MYCPQCGSSNVVKYTNKKNNNRLKSVLNQKQKRASTQKAHAVCQDCGYSWEFDESQVNRTSYNDDDQQNDSQNKGDNPFLDIENKIEEAQEKYESFKEKHPPSSGEVLDEEDLDFGGAGIIIVILIICLIVVAGMNISRRNSDDTEEPADTEQEEIEEVKSEPEPEPEPEEVVALPDLSGMTARDAVDLLEEKGLSNYTLKPDEDSSDIVVFSYSDWEVTSQDPEPETDISSDNKIVLYCIGLDEKETNELKDEIEGTTLEEALTKLDEYGYTPTYYHASTEEDFTSMIDYLEENDDLSHWIITDLKNIDISDKTVDVYINTAENIKADQEKEELTEKLSEKLEPIYAWQAAETYGEKQYPYGFELHYFINKLAEEPEDEDTWYLKAKCTITNEYNAEADYDCEIHVTGTNENPKVVDFKVY